MQYIENRKIKGDIIERIKQALDIKTNKEFSEKFNVQTSDISKWLNDKSDIPKNLQLALFYIDIVIEQKEQIKRLEKQLQTDNNADLLQNLNDFKKEVNKRLEKISEPEKKINASQDQKNIDQLRKEINDLSKNLTKKINDLSIQHETDYKYICDIIQKS